jgi:TetR/AcrR family transcriptional regulator, regulator of cefoperazone and chloramphenicol sensitivity
MSTSAPTPASHGAPTEEPRSRLLMAGLRLFAQQGYSKTSTRELAEAAQVNVAAISYYFGDKAGLYRAVFLEPMGGSPEADLARYSSPQLSLAQALAGFYAGFLEPLKQGDMVRLCMKLHFREMLEPTGLWPYDAAHGIKPLHDGLVQVLCRHMGLPPDPAGCAADADLQRLTIGLAGLGVHLHVGYDMSEALAPGLMNGAEQIERWSERLVMFGLAMVRAEAARRGIALKEEAIP